MAYDVRVRMKNGGYYNIVEEGGRIHVSKPGWMGVQGLGRPFSTFDDALEAAENDADSKADEWSVVSGDFHDGGRSGKSASAVEQGGIATAEETDLKKAQRIGEEAKKKLSEAGLPQAQVRIEFESGFETVRIDIGKEGTTGDDKELVQRGLIGILGLCAMVVMLAFGFSNFADALKTIAFWLIEAYRSSGLFTHSLVQKTQALGPSIEIVPIVLYLIYILLAIGYIVSLTHVFKGKTPKDRTNAMEILKTLTAFFIGAISGKVG